MSKLITFFVIYLIVGIIINLFAISLVKNSRDDDDDPTDLKKMNNESLLRWSETLHFRFLDKMTDEELSWQEVPCCQNKDEEKFVQDTLIKHGAIPIDKLEVGKTYVGFCRNASEAIWRGEKFVYERNKFGFIFEEEINHFQNDDGYDVFVPVKVKEYE